MPYLLGTPPDYTDINSYPFKRWLNAVYQIITSMTRLITVTTTYTVEAKDGYVRADASGAGFTITLPPALGNDGRRILIKKVDSSGNSVTISAAGSDTIEGAASVTCAAQWAKYQFISNGNNAWEIV